MSTAIHMPGELAKLVANGAPSPFRASLVLECVDDLQSVLVSLCAVSAWAEEVALRTKFELDRAIMNRMSGLLKRFASADWARLRSFAWDVQHTEFFPLPTSAPMLEHARAELAQLDKSMLAAGTAYSSLRSLQVLAPGPNATRAHTAVVLARVAPNLQSLTLTRALEDRDDVAVNLALVALFLDQSIDDSKWSHWTDRNYISTLRNLHVDAITTVCLRNPGPKQIARLAKYNFNGGADIHRAIIHEDSPMRRVVLESELGRRWVFDEVNLRAFAGFAASKAFQVIPRFTVPVEMQADFRRQLFFHNPAALQDLVFTVTSREIVTSSKNVLRARPGTWNCQNLAHITFRKKIPDVAAADFLRPLHVTDDVTDDLLTLVSVNNVAPFLTGIHAELDKLEVCMNEVAFDEGWEFAQLHLAPMIQRLYAS